MLANNAWASLVSFTQDIKDRLNSEGILENAEYIEWDAHANINDLPQKDVIGLTSFALLDEGNMLTVNGAIGIGTFNEKSLFRLRKGSALIFELLKPTLTIPYLDADSGFHINDIVLQSGTNLLPVSRADVRSIQFVQFEGLLTWN